MYSNKGNDMMRMILAAAAVAALCGCDEEKIEITAANAEVVVQDSGNQVATFAGREMTN